MTGIYKITSPTGKIYIGQAFDILKRFNQYKRLDAKKQPALYNSLLKHGTLNHIYDIIEECGINELNLRERYYQELYDSIENGLNCVYVNTVDKPKICSKETRIKIGNIHRGKITSEETKQKIRNSKINKTLSEEHKLKISIGGRFKHSKLTEEEVIEIKKMFLQGKQNKEISLKFNISRSTVKDIKTNKIWKYVNLQ